MIETVRVGALDYQVRLVERLHDHDSDLLGQIDYMHCEIYVEAQMPEQHQAVSLWHEVLHAMLQQAGKEENEELIVLLSHDIVQVLRDNPGLTG